MTESEKKLRKACTLILEAIGEDPHREGLSDTPRRFANAWKEMTTGYEAEKTIAKSMTVFDGENYDEMIVVKNISFHSLCEHHLLPFMGTVSVGYIPRKKIVGLSKIPRIVEMYARRAQNQERLTMQIADALDSLLSPKGVAVRISANHLCMTVRGVKKPNALTDTSAVRGIFRKDARARSEFFTMISS